jgi:hypothetical protein
MAHSRADQKRAEKHKQKRADAQRARSKATLPASMIALLREAAARPFGPAWVPAATHDLALSPPALLQVVVTRRMPGGLLVPGMALVDRTCLGVKDGAVKGPMTEADVGALIAKMSLRQPMVPCDAHVAVSVVFHALDYAAALGFGPHPEFPALLFGARPSRLADTPLARRDRPLYAPGSEDDVTSVVARLEALLGKGGYDFAVRGPDLRALVESLGADTRVAAAMLGKTGAEGAVEEG